MPEPIFYESHCHTPLCNHAVGEPGDYAAAAARIGFKGVIITCHCPLPDGFSASVRMAPEEFERYLEMIEQARDAWRDQVDVRAGLESDYYPGVEPWLEKLHARAPLHHVLGSVHYHVPDYRALFDPGDALEYQRIYYDHQARAAETGLFDTIAHPDLIKNDDPDGWDFERIRPDVQRALDRIAAAGTAMELNTSGLLKSIPEMNPGIEQLRLMRERDIPVVIGADAHTPDRVGDRYLEALLLLREAGYSEINFFLERKRHLVSIDTALANLSLNGSRF